MALVQSCSGKIALQVNVGMSLEIVCGRNHLPFNDGSPCHFKTNPLICFFMIGTSVVKELTKLQAANL